MDGNSGRSSVRVLQKDMTTPRRIGYKSRAMQRADKLFALDAGQAGHTETC
jgi:hypothetical protein